MPICDPIRRRYTQLSRNHVEGGERFSPPSSLADDRIGLVDGLVEVLENVVEGISSGNVDIARFESHAVLDGADGNARSDGGGAPRLGLDRLLLLMAEKRIELRPVNIPPQLDEGSHVVVVAHGTDFATEFIIGVMPRLQSA